MKPFYVYMLECNDRSFYVGHTDDLVTRLAQHETGVFGGHTSARRPVRLVWFEEQPTRDEALRFELQLKGWKRAKKWALVEGDWQRVRDLSGPRTGPDLRREGRGRPALVLRQAQHERNPPQTPGPAPSPSPARPEPVEGRALGQGNEPDA